MNRHLCKCCKLSFSVLIIVATIISNFSAAIVEAADPPVFTEVTDAAGLYYRDETWGLAWGDYNDDGHIDLFLNHHPVLSEPGDPDRDSALMRNNGNGTFTDVIHGSGIVFGYVELEEARVCLADYHSILGHKLPSLSMRLVPVTL